MRAPYSSPPPLHALLRELIDPTNADPTVDDSLTGGGLVRATAAAAAALVARHEASKDRVGLYGSKPRVPIYAKYKVCGPYVD